MRSAHHWGRELPQRGFGVKLIAAQLVKPYINSNQNDRIDAEAICAAMGRPGMRFVALQSMAQQDTHAAHQIRDEWVGQRTAKADQIRGWLASTVSSHRSVLSNCGVRCPNVLRRQTTV